MAINLTTMLLFGMFAGGGLVFRRHADVHKRFMVLATIGMLPAALGRLTITLFGSPKPALFFTATGLFVLALLVHDRRSRGRVHPVTLYAGFVLLLSFPARLALGRTEVWRTFAAWLIR